MRGFDDFERIDGNEVATIGRSNAGHLDPAFLCALKIKSVLSPKGIPACTLRLY